MSVCRPVHLLAATLARWVPHEFECARRSQGVGVKRTLRTVLDCVCRVAACPADRARVRPVKQTSQFCSVRLEYTILYRRERTSYQVSFFFQKHFFSHERFLHVKLYDGEDQKWHLRERVFSHKTLNVFVIKSYKQLWRVLFQKLYERGVEFRWSEYKNVKIKQALLEKSSREKINEPKGEFTH